MSTRKKLSVRRWHAFGTFIFACTALVAQAQDFSISEDPNAEYEWRIRQEYLNGDYIPKDIDDALRALDQLIEGDPKSRVLALSEDDFVKNLFFGFGKWMTVNWSFYEGSRLSHYLKGIGISHPDDMTEGMMRMYHRHLRAVPLEIDTLVVFLQKKREELRTQPAVLNLNNSDKH